MAVTISVRQRYTMPKPLIDAGIFKGPKAWCQIAPIVERPGLSREAGARTGYWVLGLGAMEPLRGSPSALKKVGQHVVKYSNALFYMEDALGVLMQIAQMYEDNDSMFLPNPWGPSAPLVADIKNLITKGRVVWKFAKNTASGFYYSHGSKIQGHTSAGTTTLTFGFEGVGIADYILGKWFRMGGRWTSRRLLSGIRATHKQQKRNQVTKYGEQNWPEGRTLNGLRREGRWEPEFGLYPYDEELHQYHPEYGPFFEVGPIGPIDP